MGESRSRRSRCSPPPWAAAVALGGGWWGHPAASSTSAAGGHACRPAGRPTCLWSAPRGGPCQAAASWLARGYVPPRIWLVVLPRLLASCCLLRWGALLPASTACHTLLACTSTHPYGLWPTPPCQPCMPALLPRGMRGRAALQHARDMRQRPQPGHGGASSEACWLEQPRQAVADQEQPWGRWLWPRQMG